MDFPEQPEPEEPLGDGQATAPVAEPVTPVETGRWASPAARAWLLDIYLATLIVVTFVVDQVTKAWVRDHLVPGGSIPAEGLFRITHTSNTGSIFGLFPGQTTFLMLASIVGVGILLLFYRRQPIPGGWLRTSLGLQLGGAAGNLADRITLGEVTDFIDVGIWPVFNLADSSIMVGLAILAWFLVLSPRERHAAEEPTSPGEQEAPIQSSYGHQPDKPTPCSARAVRQAHREGSNQPTHPESVEGNERADCANKGANVLRPRPSEDSDAEG